MNSALARNAYRQSEIQSKIHPVKLIHMMYERVLVLLELTENGIIENNPQIRGENLGKTIAIITELNASVKEDDDSEAARFLRGLYGAILTELPRVAISGDVEIVRRAWKYIDKLKEIWEQTAMVEADQHFMADKENHGDMIGGIYNNHVPEKTGAAGVSVSI